jgi:monooxygenase
MKRHGYNRCVPRRRQLDPTGKPFVSLTSDYVLRAVEQLPRQGPGDPWKLKRGYVSDRRSLGRPIADHILEFSASPEPRGGPSPQLSEAAKGGFRSGSRRPMSPRP